MLFSVRILFFFVCLSVQLLGETIQTFYGALEVNEPVLLELIHSPAFQRLKLIHQYGVAYYTTHREEYSRYDHSLGVFAVLRIKGAPLDEQIAGLLHDISHTVFSHTGDWVFGKEYQEGDYQSTIYKLYLANAGVEKILIAHGYTADQISPSNSKYTMLEQPLPTLCADRIDYNIQGAFYQHFLTRDEALEIVRDLQFTDGRWTLSRQDLATMLAKFSLFMTETCWGSAANYVTSRWLANAILRGLKIGLISWEDLHFSTDQAVWDTLSASNDPVIQHQMHMLANPSAYFRLVPPSEADIQAKFRCRGIDPWIRHENSVVKLTSLDPEFAAALRRMQVKAAEGWPIEMQSSALALRLAM
jgi:hypothetical protein